MEAELLTQFRGAEIAAWASRQEVQASSCQSYVGVTLGHDVRPRGLVR